MQCIHQIRRPLLILQIPRFSIVEKNFLAVHQLAGTNLLGEKIAVGFAAPAVEPILLYLAQFLELAGMRGVPNGLSHILEKCEIVGS